jgi:hypothetical protein
MPDVTSYLCPLFENLGSMFLTKLDPDAVDDTGREPKLTYCAKVHYKVEPAQRNSAEGVQHFQKNIFTSVAIPTHGRIKCAKGMPMAYSSPAVLQSTYNVEGGIRDSGPDVNFYNRVNTTTGCYGTAAAATLAMLFVEGHILDKLQTGGGVIELPGVANDAVNVVDTGHVTSYMPNELALRHRPEVLTLLYHVLESKEVLAEAGYSRNIKRTMNRAGDLPQTTFNETDFYEVMYIVQHTLCADNDGNQFLCDFLLALAQQLKVHGMTDEGGLWRQMFGQMVVRPNSVVAVSRAKAGHDLQVGLSDSLIVGSAIMLQQLVGRTLVETDYSVDKFLLPAGADNIEARRVVSMMLEDIYATLQQATGVAVSFWREHIVSGLLPTNEIDRHLSSDKVNYLGDYCPSVATHYLSAVTGNKMGNCTVDKTSGVPITFTGSYSIDRKFAAGSVLYEYDLSNRRDFSNGLTFCDPKLNPEDGLMDMEVDAFVTENLGLTGLALLADGNMLSAGEKLGSKMWRDNGDILPTGGELRTMHKCKTIVTGCTIPAWAEEGKYTVSVGRYGILGPQVGEERSPGMTRRDLVNEELGFEYSVLDKDRPKAPSLTQFLRQWRKMNSRAIEKLKRQLEASATKVSRKAARDAKVTWDPMTVTSEQKKRLCEDKKEAMVKLDKANSLLAERIDAVHCGRIKPLAKEVKEACDQMTELVKPLYSFTAVEVTDFVEGEGDEKTQVKALKWGADKFPRKWEAAKYFAEMDSLLHTGTSLYERAVEQSKHILHVLAGEAAANEFSSEIVEEHGNNWEWSTLEKQDPNYASKTFRPLSAIVEDIIEEINTPQPLQAEAGKSE